MSERTRTDVIVLQFERGLRCAGCSESNIVQISRLIKERKINAISFFASDEGFKVFELIISIDWNEFNKRVAETEGIADSISGLQESGETIEVETYLDDLVRKVDEKHLRLSYWISFSGALRIRNPEEYYRLKKQLKFEDSIYGWMNDLGRDEVDFIPDLQEIKIRIRDIQEVNVQDRSFIRKKKVLISKCEKISEQLTPSIDGIIGDYSVNNKEFPIEVSLTFQGEKKVASLLGISTLNDPNYMDIKQGIITSLVKIEENRISIPLDNKGVKQKKPVVINKGMANSSATSNNRKTGTTSTTNQTNSKAIPSDRALHNRILSVKISTFLNLICAILFIVVLVLSKYEIYNDPWFYIVIFLPLASYIGYFLIGFLPLDDQYSEWTKYDTVLVLCSGVAIILTILKGNNSFIEKADVIFFYVYPIIVLVCTTYRNILFLSDNKESEQRINIFKVVASVAYSSLLVLLIIGMMNELKNINPLNVKDIVAFGSYEQDNDVSNGNEGLKWTVHKIKDGKALLLCDTCIEAMPYNNEDSDNSWTNSDIRNWLNGEFYNSAFSDGEKSIIVETEISTGRLSDAEGHTIGETYGEDEITTDKVFVPDLKEFWMVTEELIVSEKAKVSFVSNNTYWGQDNYHTMFWIRCPYGEENNYACGYDTEGKQSMIYIFSPKMYAMVRPAIWIDLKSYAKYKEPNNASDLNTDNTSTDKQEESEHVPRYYNLELQSDSEEHYVNMFGSNSYALLQQDYSGDTLTGEIYKEFCNRLENDPLMAAACIAYADKMLGTKYTGKYYSEIENNWVSSINDIAEEFINNKNLWDGAVSSFEELLSNSSTVSIDNVTDGNIKNLLMDEGDKHPKVVSGTTKWDSQFHYLSFTISIDGTELKLSYLIETGFEPVLGEN